MATAARDVGVRRLSKASKRKADKTRRLRKPPEAVRLALAMDLPTAQVRRGDLTACDVSNHSEADHRKMVRSGERRTVRRKSKIDELRERRVLNDQEAIACEWYQRAHSLRYDTTGIIGKYGESSGGGKISFDHLPKTREQEEAWRMFEWVRSGISPQVVLPFERVILHGWPIGNIGFLFRLALNQLLHRLSGRDL